MGSFTDGAWVLSKPHVFFPSKSRNSEELHDKHAVEYKMDVI